MTTDYDSAVLMALDEQAIQAQRQCDGAYLLAGLGHSPLPQPGQTAVDYQRMAVRELKGVAGLSGIEASTMSPGAIPHLLERVVKDVHAHWQHPHDLKPGESRVVGIPDRAGRAVSTTVFGHGTQSPFRMLYGEFLEAPRLLTKIGTLSI